jgi:imidazole glycerol phosphate synthase glutamine amidotransferase subunit
MARDVVVVRTGTANLASVLAGLVRAGAAPRVSADADLIAAAGRVVLPGVGSFGAACRELDAHGLGDALAARVRAERPLLAICLGLQLLATASEEAPGVPGLGAVDAAVTRLTGAVRVPQLGWNRVEPGPGCRYVNAGFAYFANSYALTETPRGWCGAAFEYGGRRVAALERGPVIGCQFHPELSGAWGLDLMKAWVER